MASPQHQMFHGKSRRMFLNLDLINPHLICSICLDVFEHPHRLLCGHTFCYICIQNCVKCVRKNLCPECKTDFSRRKLEKDLLASKMVDDLDVKCVHSGCKFVGKHSILRKHQRNCEHKQKKECKQIELHDKVVVINEQ